MKKYVLLYLPEKDIVDLLIQFLQVDIVDLQNAIRLENFEIFVQNWKLSISNTNKKLCLK